MKNLGTASDLHVPEFEDKDDDEDD